MDWTQEQVIFLESRLRDAMCASDADTLEALLSDDLLFTNHMGHLMSKAEDLEAHRSGFVRIDRLDILESTHVFAGAAAIVSAHVRLQGTFGGESSDAELRFTRVWVKHGESARVVAGHACLVS